MRVVHHETTGSTNDDARALELAPPGTPGDVGLVVADTQSRGRGRNGNTWFSPRGSISMTLTTAGIGAADLSVLPLAVGDAVARTLRDLGAEARVKWPNDILIGDRKVCGILCESSLIGGAARVFIGIGINVEADSVNPDVAARATSLGACGVSIDRPALVAAIVASVLPALRRSPAETVASWKQVSVPWWGGAVRLVEGDLEREVTLLDVNPAGHLVTRDAAGVVRSFVSGEIRGLRGAS